MKGNKKKVVLLATVHQNQIKGLGNNSGLEDRLKYLISRLGVQNVMEEWSDKHGPSVARELTTKLGLRWANVGTPEEEQFRTYTGPINFPGHDGTLQPVDWDAPGMYEYGPFENQEARESRMATNIRAEMASHEIGLFVCGLAHLHSLFSKLRALEFEVLGFSFT